MPLTHPPNRASVITNNRLSVSRPLLYTLLSTPVSYLYIVSDVRSANHLHDSELYAVALCRCVIFLFPEQCRCMCVWMTIAMTMMAMTLKSQTYSLYTFLSYTLWPRVNVDGQGGISRLEFGCERILYNNKSCCTCLLSLIFKCLFILGTRYQSCSAIQYVIVVIHNLSFENRRMF